MVFSYLLRGSSRFSLLHFSPLFLPRAFSFVGHGSSKSSLYSGYQIVRRRCLTMLPAKGERAAPGLQQTPMQAPYDFSRGHPNEKLLPVKEMKEIMLELSGWEAGKLSKDGMNDDVVQSQISAALTYRPEAGSARMLSELKAFLHRWTSDDDIGLDSEDDDAKENANEFFMTNGVSHGIELLCRTQTQPGDIVLVERPTYFLVSDIFHNNGLIVRGLPMRSDGRGVDVNRFIQLVDSGKLRAPRMIYLIPTHQNPTGNNMSALDRRKLSEFASKNGILVVADEVYHLLDWRDQEESLKSQRRPARMAAFNNKALSREAAHGDGNGCNRKNIGCCVSVSAFTKIFAPGVRCGWIEAPEPIIHSLVNYGYVQSQGAFAPFMGDLIMCHALETGRCDSFLDCLRLAYCRRSATMCDILATDERIKVANRPTGGYFLWVRLPDDVDATNFLEFCQTRASDASSGVCFRPGMKCDGLFGDLTDEERNINNAVIGVSELSLRPCARLCFADLDEDILYEGTRRFVKAFHEYVDEMKNDSSLSQDRRT